MITKEQAKAALLQRLEAQKILEQYVRENVTVGIFRDKEKAPYKSGYTTIEEAMIELVKMRTKIKERYKNTTMETLIMCALDDNILRVETVDTMTGRRDTVEYTVKEIYPDIEDL